MATVTRAEYARHILRVADHIAANLDGDLSLDRLAEVACFSRFHFHRIWRAHTGETVADTVTRLRLYRASGHLARSDRPIGDVARQAGYGSQAAFTRAFRERFGLTPGALRARERASEYPETMSTLEIHTLEPIRCAAFPHRGAYTAIGTTFEKLAAWAAGAGVPLGPTRVIAVSYDDPKSVPEQDLRSHACIELPTGVAATPPAEDLVIAGGRHAVYRHVGPYTELHRAFSAIYGELMPAAGLVPADRPPFEVYRNNARSTVPADLVTDIHIPID